jgi:hypothetical protein
VAAASDPPITAVRPAKHQLGAVATQLALARSAGGAERPVHRVELWPLLVIRESCGSIPQPLADAPQGNLGLLCTGIDRFFSFVLTPPVVGVTMTAP